MQDKEDMDPELASHDARNGNGFHPLSSLSVHVVLAALQ
ncbi:hypothetical protein E2C01_008955 [Portunus trituberculatus]|uniref:Uncharacterized protein n=1 Tax=Portunus trituberculatus TaxID=210409 RepID=A0A5B7D478_PORTR|nr:hypothetical protein [Portunus trituberculatus]